MRNNIELTEMKNITSELCHKSSALPDKPGIIELIKKIKEEKDKKTKDELTEQLIVQNSKLIMKYAWKYKKVCQSLEIDDLFQAGAIGLLKAVDSFEPDLGYTFSTYAVWWIKSIIGRTVKCTDKLIRFPVSIEEKMCKLALAHDELKKEGIQDTPEALLIKVKELFENKRMCFTKEDIENYNFMYCVQSLDYVPNAHDRRDASLASKIKSPQDVYEEVYFTEMSNELRRFIDHILTQKEKDVIYKRFGFTENGQCYTLQQIGDEYGITRERVRQIESSAMKKLKQNSPRYGFTKTRYQEDFYG